MAKTGACESEQRIAAARGEPKSHVSSTGDCRWPDVGHSFLMSRHVSARVRYAKVVLCSEIVIIDSSSHSTAEPCRSTVMKCIQYAVRHLS